MLQDDDDDNDGDDDRTFVWHLFVTTHL